MWAMSKKEKKNTINTSSPIQFEMRECTSSRDQEATVARTCTPIFYKKAGSCYAFNFLLFFIV